MSEAGPAPKVLCVDDERRVLDGLELHLKRRYEVLTATSAVDAIEVLGKHDRIAVLVSDMRMPRIDGTAMLRRAKEMAPDCVRILLTGQADLTSSIAAVNEGGIFRYLTKPCPPPMLLAAVEAAVRHHELLYSEHLMLEQTVAGSVRLLTEVLAAAQPMLFGRASRLKQSATSVAEALQIRERWDLEVAALLCRLGLIALPADLASKLAHDEETTAEERAMVARTPQVTDHLLMNVTHLDPVRAILRLANGNRDLSDLVLTRSDPEIIARKAEILKAAADVNSLIEESGLAPEDALGVLRGKPAVYAPDIVDALGKLLAHDDQRRILEVVALGLVPGMRLAEDLLTQAGVLFAPRGCEVTATMTERLRNYPRGTFREPFQVVMPGKAVAA